MNLEDFIFSDVTDNNADVNVDANVNIDVNTDANIDADVVINESNGVYYLQFKKLLEYKQIVHGYSLGIDLDFKTTNLKRNKLSPKEYEKSVECYSKMCKAIGSDYKAIVKPNQNHTNCVKIVKSKILESNPDINLPEYDDTDGLITNKRKILLATTNADCILLLFYDPVKNVIANVHSGWRGTLQKIAVVTVKKMVADFGCNPSNIICAIAPSIRKCHFEVQKDVKDLFQNEFNEKEFSTCIEEKIPNQKWTIDTVMINKILLKNLGLKPENILDSKICSMCNSNFIHSHRVEKENYALNVALIGLR